jgi:hypothetical protein
MAHAQKRAVQATMARSATVTTCSRGTPPPHGAIEQTHGGDRDHAGNAQGQEHEEKLRGQPAEEGESRLEERDSRHRCREIGEHRREHVEHHQIEDDERERSGRRSRRERPDVSDGVAFETRLARSRRSKASRPSPARMVKAESRFDVR